jgi:hypothetical protein
MMTDTNPFMELDAHHFVSVYDIESVSFVASARGRYWVNVRTRSGGDIQLFKVNREEHSGTRALTNYADLIGRVKTKWDECNTFTEVIDQSGLMSREDVQPLLDIDDDDDRR